MRKLQPIAAAALLAFCAASAVQAAHHGGPEHGKAQSGAQMQQGAASQAGARGSLAETDRDFMKAAAESGHMEIQASKMATSKSGDAQVKKYARHLIKDHAKADAELKKVARAKGVTLPTEPSAEQQAKLQPLQAASGADFDRQFVEIAGVEAHRATIERFRKEVAEGQDPQVKAFAQKTLPKLEQHLKMAEDLQGRTQARGKGAADATSGSGGAGAISGSSGMGATGGAAGTSGTGATGGSQR